MAIQSNPVQPTSTVEITTFRIDELIKDDDDDEISEVEMNDPLLLAELEEVVSARNCETTECRKTGVSDTTALPVDNNTTLKPTNITILKTRAQEYKSLALAYKKVDHLSKARESLIVAKNIQKEIDAVSIGNGDPNFVIPPSPSLSEVPSTPKITVKTDNKIEVVQSPIKSTDTKSPIKSTHKKITQDPIPQVDPKPTSNANIYPFLLDHLQKQVQTLTTISHHYLKTAQKPQAVATQKKLVQKDIETLQALQTTNSPAPGYKFVDFGYEVEQRFDEIGIDEMEVCVMRTWDIEVVGEYYISVQFMEGRVDSGVITDSSKKIILLKKIILFIIYFCAYIDVEYKHTFPIARNKQLHRYMTKKNLVLELFTKTKSWFSSNIVPVGKAQVKLDALMEGTEVHEVVDVKEEKFNF